MFFLYPKKCNKFSLLRTCAKEKKFSASKLTHVAKRKPSCNIRPPYNIHKWLLRAKTKQTE